MKTLSVISLCILLSVVGAEDIDSFFGGAAQTTSTAYYAFTFIQGQQTKVYQQLSAYLIKSPENSPIAYGKAYLSSTPYGGTPASLGTTSGWLAVATANNNIWTFTGSFNLAQGTRYYVYLDTLNTGFKLRKSNTADNNRPTFYATSNTGTYGQIVNEFNFAVIGSSCGNTVVETGEQCDGGQCCTATCSNQPSTQRCTGNDRCKYCSGTSGSCGSAPVPSTERCGMCATGGITAYCSGSSADPRCGISCTAGAIDDPLIMGFHHQQFYFDGTVDRVFNMLSQPHLSINGLFKEANGARKLHQNLKEFENTIVIREAGIVTQNNKISFTVASGRKGNVNWNGQTIKLNSSINVADLDDCVQLTWAETSIMLTSPSFEIVFAFKDELPSEKIMTDYLNIKLVHIAGVENEMGGVIGQTAMKNASISLKPSDFEESNILSTDSIKSTYSSAAINCDQKKDRSVRFSARFEHGSINEQRAYESFDS
uniref:Predicted protein n=1 Tax=Hordeum vulgare subsp. vulgare TaxID=112509 RepID=F2DYE6_HORVV|nr:predicted protein [Hordeum vulgare subsp. vulgare]